jgi:DNA adenine methylase
MTAVFSYPGGKSKAIPVLDKLLHANFPHATTMYSPFLGGASFELHCIEQRGLTVYGNDLYKPLIQFWRALKSQRRQLQELITAWPKTSKDQYIATMRSLRAGTGPTTVLKSGALFYVMVMRSFSGALGHYSADKASRSLKNTSTKFERPAQLMPRMHLSSLDAVTFLRRHPRAGMTHASVIYLDPPYALGKRQSVLYGVSGAMHRGFNHEQLRNTLRSRKYWMLCYNDCPYIRELYSGYKVIKVQWRYSIHNHGGTGLTASREICIISTGKATKPSKTRSTSRA